jgi:lipid A ethanolaminephosphotransferase
MSVLASGLAQNAGYRSRPMIVGRPIMVLLAAGWLATVGNLPLWRALWQYEGGLHLDNVLFMLSAPRAVLAWTHLILLAIAWGRATYIVLALLLLASATVTYFEQTFGVLLDGSMVANLLQTHAAEARDLLSPGMAGWLLIAGVIPAILLARTRAAATPLAREIGMRAVHALVAIICLAAVLMLNFQHYAATLRNHRDLRLMLVPHNLLSALHAYARQRISVPHELEAIGTDARRMAAAGNRGKPMLTVFIVGETARAKNFSLNGYARPTNPELARHNVLSFLDVSACGTSTAVSLPCMFSDVGRQKHDATVALHREGLLDVLQHAGIKVLWRDNNSGCKGVCARVPHEDVSRSEVPGICRDGECYDGILLDRLQDYIDGLRDDALVVLHMNGSHGPAYFKRYPASAEAFTPACRTAELNRCPRESIVNAYDNSIRYTDEVLSQTIQLLQSNARKFDTAMLYVSDHGESLGENGLYLHGMPYALAPREQLHVPLLMWLSDGMYERLRLDRACLAGHQKDRLSHDNLFHSVLGLSMVQTAAYVEALDIFRSCRA